MKRDLNALVHAYESLERPWPYNPINITNKKSRHTLQDIQGHYPREHEVNPKSLWKSMLQKELKNSLTEVHLEPYTIEKNIDRGSQFLAKKIIVANW